MDCGRGPVTKSRPAVYHATKAPGRYGVRTGAMAQQLAAREHALIEEDALIERLRHGDQAAFERLFLRHYAQVYRVLHHLVGSREEAEDLAQETFLALYHQP